MSNNSKSFYQFVNDLTLSILGVTTKVPGLKLKPSQKVILCYHSVGNTGWRFSTPVKEFKKQVAYLLENHKVVTLSDMLKGTAGVAITFDDGYADVYEKAFPILEKHNLTATVFLIGDSRKRNHDTLDNNHKLMTLQHIKVLKKHGWEFGFHTQTHPNLAELEFKDLKYEIVTGKNLLEKKIGFKLSYFAYPLGRFNDQVLKQVAAGKYQNAFTINGGVAHLRSRYLVTRVGIEGTLSLRQFKGLMSVPGVQVNKVFLSLLQLKEKLKESLATKPSHQLELR